VREALPEAWPLTTQRERIDNAYNETKVPGAEKIAAGHAAAAALDRLAPHLPPPPSSSSHSGGSAAG
jgi:hypothetical protein